MIYNDIRRKTREINVGGIGIGASNKLAIQSMTNTDTKDAEKTLEQIKALAVAGCDIVRITVPDEEAANTVRVIKESGIKTPIVADIHFDYRAALRAAEFGVDKIRINPGNIGDEDRVRAVADACKARNIPIRIGVNSGSVEKHILAKHGAPTPEALCESALFHASILEKYDFYDTAISIKSSDVSSMIAANRLVAQSCDYPIHIGVTEAGDESSGSIKSAIGVGSLLCDGIGDTLRVSLTADPVKEVAAAKQILNALNIEGQCGMNIVSCPTCGRTKIDLIALSSAFKDAVKEQGLDDLPITVALMGCIVNGPGEAHEANIGIAGGVGEALLFSHGQALGKVKENEIISTLIKEIKNIKNERYK